MNQKKTVYINYSGFWNELDKENNFFINTLREEFTPVISDKPDYMFCSVFSNEYLNYDDAVRIFFTGESQIPDFNLVDYALGFDWIDFGDRYQRFPLYNLYWDVAKIAQNRGGMIEKPVIRDKFCSFVCSNADGDPFRQRFFELLNNARKVDSGGRFLNNVGGPVDDKLEFEREHRFSMCFENSSYPGYTTEKIIQAFAAGTIPIYWGDPEIGRIFNKDAFICVNDFHTLEAAVQRIIETDDNRDRFMSVLSEDVFIENQTPERQTEDAREFILNIFRTSKEKAFRRNRTFWGANYERHALGSSRIESKLRKIKGVISGFKRG